MRNEAILGGFAVLGSSVAWAIVGAMLSGVTIFPLTITYVLCFTTTGIMFLLSWPFKQSFADAIEKIKVWRLLVLAMLEVVTDVCYFFALQLAPVGPAMAVHLMSPVILMIAAAITSRRLTFRLSMSLILIVAAVVPISLQGGDTHGAGKLWLGLALSFVSAASLAMTLRIATAIKKAPAVTSAALGALSTGAAAAIAAGITAACGLNGLPSAADLKLLVPLGLLVGPAICLNWYALRRLPVTIIGSSTLLQPFLGSSAASALHGAAMRPLDLVSVVFVVIGIYLDLPRPEPAEPEPTTIEYAVIKAQPSHCKPTTVVFALVKAQLSQNPWRRNLCRKARAPPGAFRLQTQLALLTHEC